MTLSQLSLDEESLVLGWEKAGGSKRPRESWEMIYTCPLQIHTAGWRGLTGSAALAAGAPSWFLSSQRGSGEMREASWRGERSRSSLAAWGWAALRSSAAAAWPQRCPGWAAARLVLLPDLLNLLLHHGVQGQELF